MGDKGREGTEYYTKGGGSRQKEGKEGKGVVERGKEGGKRIVDRRRGEILGNWRKGRGSGRREGGEERVDKGREGMGVVGKRNSVAREGRT